MIIQVIEVHLSRLKTKYPKNQYIAYINESQYKTIFKDHILDQQQKLFEQNPIIHDITIQPGPRITKNTIVIVHKSIKRINKS